MDEEPKGVLSIHKESGTVSVHRAVDYEEKEMLKVRLNTYYISTGSLYCCKLLHTDKGCI